jgi:hypothetical protein
MAVDLIEFPADDLEPLVCVAAQVADARLLSRLR